MKFKFVSDTAVSLVDEDGKILGTISLSRGNRLLDVRSTRLTGLVRFDHEGRNAEGKIAARATIELGDQELTQPIGARI